MSPSNFVRTFPVGSRTRLKFDPSKVGILLRALGLRGIYQTGFLWCGLCRYTLSTLVHGGIWEVIGR